MVKARCYPGPGRNKSAMTSYRGTGEGRPAKKGQPRPGKVQRAVRIHKSGHELLRPQLSGLLSGFWARGSHKFFFFFFIRGATTHLLINLRAITVLAKGQREQVPTFDQAEGVSTWYILSFLGQACQGPIGSTHTGPRHGCCSILYCWATIRGRLGIFETISQDARLSDLDLLVVGTLI